MTRNYEKMNAHVWDPFCLSPIVRRLKYSKPGGILLN